MKTNLRKALFVAAAMMLGVSAWADTTAGTITKEMNYRTDAATPTKFTTIRESNSTNKEVEISYSSRFIAGMTLSIPEINNATEVTLKVTRVSGQTNKGDLNVWAFPYDLITASDFSDGTSQFCENVKTVMGVYPGTAPTKDPIGTVTTDATSGYTQTVSFKGDALTALKNAGTITGGTLTVNIIATTKESTQNFKWNAISASADAPVLTVTFEKSGSEKTSVTTSTADTYVRMGNTTKQGSAAAMEIHSEFTTDEETSEKTYTADFVGLMQFEIPAEAKTSDYEIESATLRLTTNMCKGATVFNIYSYSNAFDEANAIYSTETSYIDAARKTTPLTFTAKYGSRAKALNDNPGTATYDGAIAKWTNTVDITSLVKAEASNKFQIMIDASTSNSQSAKFYTKEAEGFTNSYTSNTYTTEQLIPQLTVVYKKKAAPAEVSANMQITEAGCATFCAPFDVEIPTGVKAYTADKIVDDSWIKMTEITTGTIAAGTPVVLYSNAALASTEFKGEATVKEAKSGVLTGNIGTEKIADPVGSYALQTNNGVTGWYEVKDNGTTLYCGVNRCYMTKPVTPAKAGYFTMNFGGEATAINSVIANEAQTKKDGKYFVNGQIVIVKAGKAYSTNGAQIK